MDEDDRNALEVMLSLAPPAGRDISTDRHAEVTDLEREHRLQREKRARLASEAEWTE